MNRRFQRPTANTYYKFEDASEEEEVDFRIAELENDTEEMIQKMQTLRFVLSAAEKLSTRRLCGVQKLRIFKMRIIV